MKIEGNELKKWKGLRNWMEKAKKKKEISLGYAHLYSQ